MIHLRHEARLATQEASGDGGDHEASGCAWRFAAGRDDPAVGCRGCLMGVQIAGKENGTGFRP